MRKSRFKKEQIVAILKESEAGASNADRHLQEAWDLRSNLLQVACQVWWHASERREENESPRGRERYAKAYSYNH